MLRGKFEAINTISKRCVCVKISKTNKPLMHLKDTEKAKTLKRVEINTEAKNIKYPRYKELTF